MSFLRNVLVLGLVVQVVVGQSSVSSDQMFSIQTDPATPTASASSAASPSASGGLESGMGAFPEQCKDDCAPIAQSLSSCGLGDLTGFNVTCLCNSSVEKNLMTCIDCALGADPNPQQAVNSYQSLLDAQCAYASVTLSSATVGFSSSTSGSVSASSTSTSSPSSASSSAATTSMSGSASSTLATSPSQASSASSGAASSTPSNTASRGMDRAWAWGLTGVGGVVVAAAVGL